MAVQKQDGWATDARPGNSDLTGKEFLFCTRNADGTIDLCGAAGVIAGVISEGKAAGLWSSFNTGGMLKVIAGGAIAVGDVVGSGANGVAISGAANPAGRARNATAGAGEYVEVMFDRT